MRLEVTRKSDLAVRAMCRLGRVGRAKGSELAKIAGTSQAFMAQVLAPLVQAGWVRSIPGPTGGYELEVDLHSVSMLDLIESIEGPTETGVCALRGGPCPGSDQCALHEAWSPARDALLDRLRHTSLAVAADCLP
ncbi:MAG: Rrf2 family transcriptional regulator [Acidimicrobiia bacterium]|nr:Rrf2 family transcriptional regulator [Acidimicrobiia bacterium]